MVSEFLECKDGPRGICQGRIRDNTGPYTRGLGVETTPNRHFNFRDVHVMGALASVPWRYTMTIGNMLENLSSGRPRRNRP
jgi:hypothetical protein